MSTVRSQIRKLPLAAERGLEHSRSMFILIYTPTPFVLIPFPCSLSSFHIIMQSQTPATMSSDAEKQTSTKLYMLNSVAHSLSWANITVTVKDRATHEPRDLISNVSGRVQAGTCICSSTKKGRWSTNQVYVQERFWL